MVLIEEVFGAISKSAFKEDGCARTRPEDATAYINVVEEDVFRVEVAPLG